MQCLVGLSFSQGLSLVIMAISFEAARGVHALCYTLGVIQHYLILLALTWLCVYPVLMVVRVFRRLWYEKEWLIVPFAAVCIGEGVMYVCVVCVHKIERETLWEHKTYDTLSLPQLFLQSR